MIYDDDEDEDKDIKDYDNDGGDCGGNDIFSVIGLHYSLNIGYRYYGNGSPPLNLISI